jgi:hypothetical protein
MKEKKDKFAVISRIYSHLTEESRENLVKTAKHLLKVQNDDLEMVANTTKPQKKKGKG